MHTAKFDPQPIARPPKRTGHRKAVIALAAASVVILAVILILCCRSCSAGNDGLWYDTSAQEGYVSGISEEEIQRIVNEEAEKGYMHVSIKRTICFPNGSSEPGTARIENLETNTCDQKVRICLADTGELLYESGAIAPGYSVDTISLLRELDAGTYLINTDVIGYDCETHEETGSITIEMNLVVS